MNTLFEVIFFILYFFSVIATIFLVRKKEKERWVNAAKTRDLIFDDGYIYFVKRLKEPPGDCNGEKEKDRRKQTDPFLGPKSKQMKNVPNGKDNTF